jgi:8-oxo-dGTP pyrophosphatase MutT (NUDIX family)
VNDLPQRLIAALLDEHQRGRRDRLQRSSEALNERWSAGGWAAPRRPGLVSLAPTLAYGRHRGPAPRDVRRAAVAMLWLQRRDGSWWLPLTLRPHNLRHHGGQICFPGGMIEQGETPAQAALREFEEELGIAPASPLMCGEMEPVYVYSSDNLVFPVVFTAAAPQQPWKPDPVEVDSILEMPLSMLLDQPPAPAQRRSRQIMHNGCCVGAFDFKSVAYPLEEHMIWGVTARILRLFLYRLADAELAEAPAATASPWPETSPPPR